MWLDGEMAEVDQFAEVNRVHMDARAEMPAPARDGGEDEASSENYSVHPGKRRPKPYWRGRIHRVAFFVTIGLFLAFLLFVKHLNKFFLSVYFVSQLILYGVSSTYHMTDWKNPRAEAIFRKLDHSSIFVMISGTQTCVVLSVNKLSGPQGISALLFIPFTYLLALIGILKVFCFATIPKYMNILYYIFHGCAPTPFFTLRSFFRDKYVSLACIAGGVFYILGSAVYGTRKPDPWPSTFGYHEIFHALTILANLCFMSTLIRASQSGNVK